MAIALGKCAGGMPARQRGDASAIRKLVHRVPPTLSGSPRSSALILFTAPLPTMIYPKISSLAPRPAPEPTQVRIKKTSSTLWTQQNAAVSSVQKRLRDRFHQGAPGG
jgi:hypothetical protein